LAIETTTKKGNFMKKLILIALSFAIMPAFAGTPAETAFTKMLALAGTWNFVNSGDTVNYQVVSDGNTVMETDGDMVTLYHMDGDSLLATHYCDMGNQPRMRATDFSNPNVISYNFVDITNSKPGDGHIKAVVFTWTDDNHLKEDWTYDDGKGGEGHEIYDLVRAANSGGK
jgi:hypothetical protein